MNETDTRRPSIRQAHADRTKAAILDAACHVFATCGYGEAGVRDIAARAEVNPALVARYFGSKLELFEAALEASFDVSHFTDAPRQRYGEVVAASLCGSVDEDASAVPMLVFAAGDSEARKAALRILKQRAVEPLEAWFGEPEAAERAAQLMLLVTGFFTYRIMLPLGPVAGQPSAAMQRWLADAFQELVDRREAD
jgi:AcrR family transcriptional regulator